MEDKKVYAGTRKEWRNWLRKNHKKEKKVWLIKHKKHTGKATLNNKETMEEAICFGWIDTTVKRLDDEKYMQAFVKRNEKSRWSNNTLKYAENMIKKGKMSKFGMEMYELGKKKPTLDHGLSKNPRIPVDLKKELSKNKKAEINFKNFSPSYRRHFICWIERAKRKETRLKRIKEVFKISKENNKRFGM